MASPREVDVLNGSPDQDPERQARIDVIALGLGLIARSQMFPEQRLADGWTATALTAPVDPNVDTEWTAALPVNPVDDRTRFGVVYQRGQAGVDYVRFEIEPDQDGIKTTTVSHEARRDGRTNQDTFEAVVHPSDESFPAPTRQVIDVLRGAFSVAVAVYTRPGTKMASVARVSDETIQLPASSSRTREGLRSDLQDLNDLRPRRQLRQSSKMQKLLGKRVVRS